MNRLPVDTVYEIASYCDSLHTLYDLRSVCTHLFEASERADGHFYSTVDVIVYEEREPYHDLFQHIATLDKDHLPSNFLKSVFAAVINGSTVRLEQFGVAESRFVIEMFFEVLLDALQSGKDVITSLLLPLLKQKSGLWNTFDRLAQIYPRHRFLQLFQQLDEQSVLRIFEQLEVAGVDILGMKFTYERDYAEREFDFISNVSTKFSILHLATWKRWKNMLSVYFERKDVSYALTDIFNRTPLHYAVTFDDSEIAKFLFCELKCDPVVPDFVLINSITLAHLYSKTDLLALFSETVSSEVVEQFKPLPEDMNLGDDLIAKENSSMQQLYTEYNEGLSDNGYVYYEGKFLPDLRTDLVFADDYYWPPEDSSSTHESGHTQEPGISSTFAYNSKLEDVEEAIRLFEQTSKETMEEDGEYVHRFTTKIVSRDPYDDYVSKYEEINENGKRKIPLDVSEEQFAKRKKLLSEAVVNRVGKRSELSIPKWRARALHRELLQDYSSVINRFTPLADFMIQHATEQILLKLFRLSSEIAAFYKRETVEKGHYRMAMLMLQNIRSLEGPVDSLDKTKCRMSDDESDAYSIESTISSDQCSDIIGLATSEVVAECYDVVYHGPNSVPVEVGFEWDPYQDEVNLYEMGIA